jgi:enterochelin esterase-like enzyme
MGLTSGLFLWVALAAVVALPLGTVALWNRLRGPWPVRHAQRLTLVMLCQTSAVLVAALVINNAFQLYTSWSDLLGHNGPPGTVQAGGSVGMPTVAIRSAGPDGALSETWLFRPDGATPGQYHAVITGPASRVTGDVVVWLPPQYTERAYASTQFPVIQLLSGFPGSPYSWIHGLSAAQIFRHEIDRGTVRPAIIVAASINVDPPHNADCSDIPRGPQVATWLSRDVRALVESSFRAQTDRSGWGLMGYSEGGLCASKLVLQYPDRYGAAVSMSGDDHPGGDLLRPGTPEYDANSPLWLLEHRPAPSVALLLTGTLQDGSTAAEADAMGSAARPPTVVERLISARGGHNVGVWKSVEPEAFAWLSGRLCGPREPGPPAPPKLAGAVGRVK